MFNQKTKQKLKKGFSLVEIVVVLAIMAIIAAVVAPQFGNYTKKADTNRIQSELSTIHTVAINLAEEKESGLHEYFEGSKKDELKKELQSVTNYDMSKIEEFKFGVANRKFVVYVDSDEDYYWDGQNLTQTAPSGIVPINTDARAKLVAEFTKTGGNVPDVVSKFFIFNGGGEYGDTIEGLTNLGREYFEDNLIIPEKDDAGTVIKYIKADAFRGEGITSVYIPPNVETVGANSFANNGLAKNSNSIENPSVNKYFNGYTGEWRVIDGVWQKTVQIIQVGPADTFPRFTRTFNYKSAGLNKLHLATVTTRQPITSSPVNDPFGILSPAATPNRQVPSSFVDNPGDGSVSVTFNKDNSTAYGERTLYRGTQFETRTVTGFRPSPGTTTTAYYSGYLSGFLFTGTLPQDKVINGGTPAGSKTVSGQLSPNYNEGGLNGYSGTLQQQSVIAGTPAGSKVVNGISIGANTASTAYYAEPGTEGYSGTLDRYVFSGLPYATRAVTAHPTANYNQDQFVGTLTRDAVPVSGTDKHTKTVTDQPSAAYDDGSYVGTLSKYDKLVTAAQSTTGKHSITANSRENFRYEDTGSYNYITGVRTTYQIHATFFYASATGGWANWTDRVDRSSTTNSTITSGGRTYSYWSAGNAVTTNTTYFTRTNLSNNSQYHIQTYTLYGTFRAWIPQGTWKSTGVQYYADASFPDVWEYNVNGYSGNIPKDGPKHTNNTIYNSATGSPSFGSTGYRLYTWTQDYAGTVTKPAVYVTRYEGSVTRPDTRVWSYSGTAVRASTEVFRYRGTIYKSDTRVWNYHGTVTKPDTRVWDYTGTVTGDTREYTNYYYYTLTLE